MSGLSGPERTQWRSSVAAVVARCASGGAWDALFDLGVLDTGGLEDLAVAIEECGAVTVATPLLGHVFGLRALYCAPASPIRDRLVDGGVSGRERLALAAGGISATPIGDDWALHGETRYVLECGAADWLVVEATTSDGPGAFVVPADAIGVTRRPLPTLDPSRVLWRADFHGAAATLLGMDTGRHVERLRSELATLVAADSIGGARAVLGDAVEHARQRMQFGRPIGSFQAVKHRLADVSSQLDGAVAAVGYALRRLDLGAPDAALAASVAKLAAADAYLTAAEGAIQTYGGIGFTWEHPAHIHLKRAYTNSQLAGGAALHLDLVADRAGIGSYT
ncbi:acyl-CoA dehydrogenase family protein [Dactylosporangium sp. NPDC049525]|uniref:acyl-CoA dehydrogenase family protein n=1 Tax=Dactylosporangium sp. NPDC049525 TaxID=3154730 RepID=UPI0034361700